MDILEKALKMLEDKPLCDSCLGRQFAFLGYRMENKDRGKAIKDLLVMEGHRLALQRDPEGLKILRILAENCLLYTSDAADE